MTMKGKSVTVGAIAAAVGCLALSFVPGFRGAAVVWWMLGAAGLLTAFVAVVRSRPRRTRTFAFSAVAFVAAAAAAIALVGAISPARAEAAIPPASSDAGRVVQLASQLHEHGGEEGSRAITTARSINYSV